MLNRRVKRVLLALGMSLAIVSLTTGCSMLKKQPETESETEKQTEKQTAPESESETESETELQTEIAYTSQDKSIQIGGLKPYKITNLGVARTFQNIRLFKSMTVLENVKVAMHKNIRYGTLAAILRLPAYYKEEKWVEEKAEELLKEVGLYSLRNELATNLPYGKQRRLEIARALAIQPKILYLDEPAAGMNPQETKELTELIDHIREKYKLTVILIEHDMSLVMKICERIYVLNYGKMIANGTPEEIKQNEFVVKAYLGEEI